MCPDLTCLDLICPDLTFPDLTCPDLICPDLTCPELTSPNLTCPDLTCPDLIQPVLNWPSTLTWPDLNWPDLNWPVLNWPVLTCWPPPDNLHTSQVDPQCLLPWFKVVYPNFKLSGVVGGWVGGWVDFNPIIMPLRGPTFKLKQCKISTQVEIASWARVWQYHWNSPNEISYRKPLFSGICHYFSKVCGWLAFQHLVILVICHSLGEVGGC